MRELEIKEFDRQWEEDEIMGIGKCPDCGLPANIVVSIYRDWPAECPNCKSRFVITQNTKLYRLVEDDE